jgi:hypothetical protein
MFSAIDALAALNRRKGTRATRSDFMEWVDEHLLGELDPPLNAEDLYGARCGILHAYSPTSDLSQTGKAKVLIYKWRHGHRPDDPVLEERARTATVVELEVLWEALQRAVESFSRRISEDADVRERVEANLEALLCYEPWHPVSITVAA